MKIPARKRKSESGQAIILVILAMSIFLLGALGFAIDGSQLYAQRQMAQAAADAAAQAGIMSIFDGTSGAWGTHTAGAAYTCAASDSATPCYYAQIMNGFNGASDTVTVTPNPTGTNVPAGTLSASDAINLLKVNVQRHVPTTLMKLLGISNSTVSASATAAILSQMSPVPIIVTHPSMSGALSSNGSPTITICGGPSKSIEVNSYNKSPGALSMNSNTTINLSHAGPLDPGTCTTGTGANFGVYGLPSPSNIPFTFQPGTLPGVYQQPSSPILDPLANVSAPSVPSAAPAPTNLAPGVSGCPASPVKPCVLYAPGLYSSGIDAKDHTLVFEPGIYYITSNGFGSSANGDMEMATGFTDGSTNRTGATSTTCCGTATGWTGNMLVYNTGNGSNDVFSVGANGSANLVGSPIGSSYKGILLFEDRGAAAHISPPAKNAHSIGGGGAMTLSGTIYVTNTLSIMTATPSQYQELDLQGNPKSATLIQGEIITSHLNLGGTGGITMNLSNLKSYNVRQVALVQ